MAEWLTRSLYPGSRLGSEPPCHTTVFNEKLGHDAARLVSSSATHLFFEQVY